MANHHQTCRFRRTNGKNKYFYVLTFIALTSIIKRSSDIEKDARESKALGHRSAAKPSVQISPTLVRSHRPDSPVRGWGIGESVKRCCRSLEEGALVNCPALPDGMPE